MLNKKTTEKSFLIFIVPLVLFGTFFAYKNFVWKWDEKAHAQSIDEITTDDYDYYQKYSQYLDYQKKESYQDYKKYAKNKKEYGFKSTKERNSAKSAYKKYKAKQDKIKNSSSGSKDEAFDQE